MIATSNAVRLYDATDVTWIAVIVDHVMDSLGQPWRVLRERLDHAPVRPARVAAILGALRRLTAGRAQRARIARQVRARVLGHPALDDATRQQRLATAAAELGLEPDAVEGLLWIDLADERPVVLPDGRPDERLLAAHANLERIQHAVRRARRLRLRVGGDAGALIRAARRLGLLVTVTRDAREDAGPVTVLDVIGPLSLFHATTVYGRALALLVPLLAEVERFELSIQCDLGYGATTLRVAPPVLLPALAASRARPSLAARLARALGKAAPDVTVELDPPAITTPEGALLFPDLALERGGRRWWLELVGFATAEFLAARVARYRDAGISDVILCVDDQRAAPDAGGGATLRYQRSIDAAAVLERLS